MRGEKNEALAAILALPQAEIGFYAALRQEIETINALETNISTLQREAWVNLQTALEKETLEKD